MKTPRKYGIDELEQSAEELRIEISEASKSQIKFEYRGHSKNWNKNTEIFQKEGSKAKLPTDTNQNMFEKIEPPSEKSGSKNYVSHRSSRECRPSLPKKKSFPEFSSDPETIFVLDRSLGLERAQKEYRPQSE